MSRAERTEAALEFLEAAYSWELSEAPWLDKLARSAARVWGRPRWACGFTYDASDLTRFSFGQPVLIGGGKPLKDFLMAGMSRMTPDMLARTFRGRAPMGFGRPMGGIDKESEATLARFDTVDYFGLNGLDASGKGCFVGIGAERTRLSGEEILIFQRLAYHLASAFRIRRRLEESRQQPLDAWEALLSPEGELLESRGAAGEEDAGRALRRATRTMQGVRRRETRDEPTEAWRPRVRGRWTLIDSFARRGRRYIIARENQVVAPGLDLLTDREQQVVASAASGKTNKEIAYDLGISHATIRVLLARAFTRLGVRSRRELLELPMIKALRGEMPPPG